VNPLKSHRQSLQANRPESRLENHLENHLRYQRVNLQVNHQ
jgi:hypothetical protein